MHGLGNDFVVIDGRQGQREHGVEITPAIAQKMCDRRLGVGADQLLWILDPSRAHADRASAQMFIYNSDGTRAEMCGNGIRAVTLFLYGKFAFEPGGACEFVIETLAGLKTVKIGGTRERPTVQVDMGVPVLGGGFEKGCPGEALLLRSDALTEQREVRFFEVNMGNPHAVIFVDSLDGFPIEALGPAIERHARFPKRTNVEFVCVRDDHTVDVQVWERGAGITPACGTGACAVAVAALKTAKVSAKAQPLRVCLPGGVLFIQWAGEGSPVLMEGPAIEVFRGEMDLAVARAGAD